MTPAQISGNMCTILHKRKISAGAETPHNYNKSLQLRKNWLLPKISRNAGARRVASHLKSWTYLRSSVFIPAALGFSLLRPYNSRKLCSAPIFISWGDRALAVKTFVSSENIAQRRCEKGGKSPQILDLSAFICVHPCGPRLFSFYVRTTRASCVRPQFSFPGVTVLWRSRLSIRKTAPQPVPAQSRGTTVSGPLPLGNSNVFSILLPEPRQTPPCPGPESPRMRGGHPRHGQ